MAHKKAGGSSRNGRDSNGQRRGMKAYGGQVINAGTIIIRQLGTRIHAGRNVKIGKDWTLFATIDGQISFSKGRYNRSFAHVDPVIAANPA